MASEIFKVQRPLASSESDSPWLLYNKDRSRQIMIAESIVDPEIKAAVGHAYKAFIRGHYQIKPVNVVFVARAKPQDW